MLPADRISDAFTGGRADPNQGIEELERFYLQAKWLGECAEYIYPPHVDRSDDARMMEWETIWNSFCEQHSAAMSKTADAKFDREKWESAINAFALQLQDPATTSLARAAYERLDENALDAIADRLQSERRKLFPTLVPWKWFSVTEPMRLACQKYQLAHRLWSTRAESRIREYIIAKWAVEGSSVGGVTKVEFNSKNGIEYFLASNEDLVILCFRGTEMHKLSDIITDMRAWQVEVPEKRKKPLVNDAKSQSSPAASPKKTIKSQAPRFHEGFWNALHGVWEQIEQNPVWEAFKSPTKKQVWITGHSLGGALATLAAYRLVRDEVISADQISGVFTFGQPRLGDVQFAGGYSGTRDRHYRFVHNCDIVTMIPPKSIRWLIRAGSMFLKQDSPKQPAGATAGGSKAPQANSETLRKSYEYADVGNILFLNRASRIRLLAPKPWWPFDLFMGRIGSLLRSPFVDTKYRSWVDRYVPGVADHSMQEYSRVLKIACAHCAFLREAVARMKERPELRMEKESVLTKTAEQAWKKLRAGADRVAWDAKKEVLSSIAEVNVRRNKLKDDQKKLTAGNNGDVKHREDMTKEEISQLNELVSEIDKVRLEIRKWNAANAVIWFDTWHAEISKQRSQALDSVVSGWR